jgi:hypothetical protein
VKTTLHHLTISCDKEAYDNSKLWQYDTKLETWVDSNREGNGVTTDFKYYKYKVTNRKIRYTELQNHEIYPTFFSGWFTKEERVLLGNACCLCVHSLYNCL